MLKDSNFTVKQVKKYLKQFDDDDDLVMVKMLIENHCGVGDPYRCGVVIGLSKRTCVLEVEFDEVLEWQTA
jgi:hypothetical protein